MSTNWKFNDGGRSAAGFKGFTGDCAVRTIAIATGSDYLTIYNSINELGKKERKTKRRKTKSRARTGVYKSTLHRYITSLGWKWVPTMGIGTGCKVHLRSDELPCGTLMVRVSNHLTCVIDGVIQDTYDCSRDGTRCVYGYYIKEN